MTAFQRDEDRIAVGAERDGFGVSEIAETKTVRLAGQRFVQAPAGIQVIEVDGAIREDHGEAAVWRQIHGRRLPVPLFREHGLLTVLSRRGREALDRAEAFRHDGPVRSRVQ